MGEKELSAKETDLDLYCTWGWLFLNQINEKEHTEKHVFRGMGL